MKSFELHNAKSVREASSLLSKYKEKAALIAGGGDLLYMMKDQTSGPKLQPPDLLVNLQTVPGLKYIRQAADGGLQIGAMTTILEIEESQVVREKFPVLAQAASQIASPQLRNMTTLGGNLCQRPRCWYFRSPLFPCIKKGGNTCFAAIGENRDYHSVLEGGPCFVAHPSDMAPALMAMNARVKISGPKGQKIVPLEKFFIAPRVTALKENVLEPGELITEVQVPAAPANAKGVFMKKRIRGSWDFALASVAAMITLKDGMVQDA
ncbi:MAG: FAD binding domain-containing protein, partial [Deltaproteobacteria bacterium]|nr:FAD binding domain-containing protein [Deltaproteobacteria bacterium]